MSAQGDWKPLTEPPRAASVVFNQSPFVRLARAHVFLLAGDTLVALALAGSLFFSIDPDAARWRVALYLLLTVAPFAVVTPLIGPMLDRAAGGRRVMVFLSGAIRAVVALLMMRYLNSLLLFPLAFTMLVLGKSYHVAKSAIVPSTISTSDELVKANSRLSLLSGIAGGLAAVPGGLALLIGGAEWVCALAMLTFVAGSVLSLRLPPAEVVERPATEEEKVELRGAGIILAASAMGIMRGIVGFVTFLIAFTLRGSQIRPYVEGAGAEVGAMIRDGLGYATTTIATGSPAWHFGVAAALAGIGTPLGALLTPTLRKTLSEERIIMGSLALVTGVGALSMLFGGIVGAAAIALGVAVGSSAGKLGFDSILQRDAPDADRGRSFARFESRFQLIWVFGAAIPVVIPIPARVGYLLVAAAAGFAATSYVIGQRFLETTGKLPPRKTPEVANRLKAEALKRTESILHRRGENEVNDMPPSETPTAGGSANISGTGQRE